MCACGKTSKIEFDGVYRPKNPQNIELIPLSALSTATRNYRAESGRRYLGGGAYHTTMVFPDDVNYLLTLTEHFSEV